MSNRTMTARLAGELQRARQSTDALFGLLRPGALTERPIPERHRFIFYLGHLEAFDWNMVCRTACRMGSFNPEFDRLFAFGIDPTDGSLPTDLPGDWPPVPEIHAYNSRIRRMVDDILNSGDFAGSEYLEDGMIFHVAIEHRLMHAETLAYMLHALPYAAKACPPVVPEADAAHVAGRCIDIPEGMATVGLTKSLDAPFGWDNEFAPHTVQVPAFSIDATNVTNGQFLEFVRENGYEARELWDADAWEWIHRDGIRHPKFWSYDGRNWRYRGMFGEIPLPLSWPVYVSHAEATAYARWKRRHLPTEAQFHRAAFGTPGEDERIFPWGSAPPHSAHGNFGFNRWDPEPAGSHPEGDSAFGVADLMGNGWEWTSTPFAPFPGFKPLPFYPGYSADFFDGKHYVMKGASPRTAATLVRRSFRNWFQPFYPNVYATFRCVDN